MDVAGKKVESQVQFWSLLGPFFILLSISVLLLKISFHWYFPLSALVGIPLCVKWKMKGMAAALCCLLFLSGIHYQTLELDDRYWHVGLALAMAFSFIVLTLSLEEAEGVVGKLKLESQSRLDNYLLLDEKLKQAELNWADIKEKSKAEAEALTQEILHLQEDKQTFYKLAQLAKDELVQVRNQHDLLLQDLVYKKQQVAQLYERLEEAEMTVQDFVNSDAEKRVQILKEDIASIEREKEILQGKIQLMETERQVCKEEKVCLLQELEVCRERDQLSLVAKKALEEEHLRDLQNWQVKYDILEEENKKVVENHQRCLQESSRLRDLKERQQQVMEESWKKIEDSQKKIVDLEAQFRSERDERVLKDKQIKQQEENKEEYKKVLEQVYKELDLQKEKNTWLQKESQENQDVLKYENDVLKEECRQVKECLDLAKQELEKCENRQPVALPKQDRRIEGMYLQLREQFQEKCFVLDQTRRELFRANEALLKCQKEYEEEHIFDQSLIGKYWQRHCLKLGNACDTMEKRYQQEVTELTELVNHLLVQMAANRVL